MVRENALQEIRSSWRELIRDFTDGEAKDRVNGEPSYICPFCGHGKGGDGLTYNPRSRDGNSLKCFGCGWSGDIVDLCKAVTSSDTKTAISLLAGSLNITIDSYDPAASDFYSPVRKNDLTERRTIEDKGQGDINPHVDPKTAQRGSQSQTEALADYTQYYKVCRERLSDPAAVSYLQARGISVDTAEAYWLGYDPAADPANNPGSVNEASRFPTPRIIIPTTAAHYVGRSIDPDTQKGFAKMNAKGSTPGIFNAKALYAQEVQELFVVEGVFDALSIIETGSPAISLNSTVNAELLLNMLKEKPTDATLILCLDNDSSGNGATDKLKEGLRRLNISFITADICGTHKDPNEALVADPEGFAAAVGEAKRSTAAKPDNTANYIDLFMTAEMDRFKSDISTGYHNLDRKAGGLYGGLYCIAAISSLGKTTFAAQMADQIAEGGNDVLFFSLEQSRLEIVSKSLSRIIAQRDPNTKVSSLSLRKGYNPEERAKAIEEYKRRVGDRMSVIEGNFNCDVSFIGDYVRQYIRRTKSRPVVFIDYLQVLQPATLPNGKQQTAREAIDSTVTELKRLSREQDIPVIVISSVNRSNYLTPIDFESLKESGGIEYTCDVIWGLQLRCLSENLFSDEKKIKDKRERVKEAKAENPRKIELSCLKNRYGIATFSCNFNYYPQNDLFVTAPDEEELPFAKPRRY
jgi:replicative DNA helicase